MTEIFLTICIPTYNRSSYLLKNLNLLNEYIKKGNYLEEIEIVISDNNSSDTTSMDLSNFTKKNPSLSIRYFKQPINIGLEKNALFVLKEAKGTYIMFLGDDDFIEYEYLSESLNIIKRNNQISAVIPNNVPIDINGVQIGTGRDDAFSSALSKKGFSNCLKNSWRGHQLSGLILKRNNLYEAYIQQKVGNIYLFIFFVAYSCLKGDTFHLTDYSVKVTDPGQEKKDWNYGKDGLVNEVFDNYNKLPISYFKKTILQLHLYYIQRWRLWKYLEIGYLPLFKAFIFIWSSKNSTFLFKIIFPFEVVGLLIGSKFKQMFSK